MKDEVLKSFALPQSELRLLFATEAFGMGVNVPDIRRIIHAGTPCTLESESFQFICNANQFPLVYLKK